MNVTKENCFTFPALRGVQGGQLFYSAVAPMRTLKRLIAFDNAGSPMERSQRDVNPTRAKKITAYINDNQKDGYVLPSLTGVIVGAHEYDEKTNQLYVDMGADVLLFDGQHRASGIINAEDVKSMIPLMLFVDLSLAKRQQYFTDLNRNAVKPASGLSAAYDGRDEITPMAHHVADHPPFAGLVDHSRNVASPSTGLPFTFKAIHDATKVLNRDTDADQEAMVKLWRTWADRVGWGALDADPDNLAEFRERNLSTHGVMIAAFAKAVTVLGFAGAERMTALLTDKDMQGRAVTLALTAPGSYQGKCVCRETGRMLTDGRAIKLAACSILKTLGVRLVSENKDLSDLYEEVEPGTQANERKALDSEQSEEAKAMEAKALAELDKWGRKRCSDAPLRKALVKIAKASHAEGWLPNIEELEDVIDKVDRLQKEYEWLDNRKEVAEAIAGASMEVVTHGRRLKALLRQHGDAAGLTTAA